MMRKKNGGPRDSTTGWEAQYKGVRTCSRAPAVGDCEGDAHHANRNPLELPLAEK